jgi:tetratricopeptide (TPR) repeat protein
MDRLGSQVDGEELLRLAVSVPPDALARTASILANGSDPLRLSFAHQARGIILRDQGQTAAAIRELRRALDAAQVSGNEQRVADVRASLGAALVMHGHTKRGLAELDAAASAVHGRLRATVIMRRAYVLTFLGRADEALIDLRTALTGLRRAGDTLWEARTLNNRANLLLTLGEVDRAERDLRRAEQIFQAMGQQLEAVHSLHNLGELALLQGDLPRAFTLFDRAALMFDALGAPSAELVVDRCQAYLVAGLSEDAVELAGKALEGPLQPRHRAEVRLVLATAALSHGESDTAVRAARLARRGFAAQDRPFWVTRAELVLAQAEYVSGRRRRGQLETARRVAHELHAARAEEAAVALLLAGRLALDTGADGHADLQAAARFRHSFSPQLRATGWLALALDRDHAGDRPGVLRAARRGLDAVIAQREVLGSTQLRALATRNTAELTALALRHVLAAGSARELLRWSERARAAALATPAVRPPPDPALAGQLAAMRSVARALDEARDGGRPTAELAIRLRRLEASIDQRRRRAGRPGSEQSVSSAGEAAAGADPGGRASAHLGMGMRSAGKGLVSPEEERESINGGRKSGSDARPSETLPRRPAGLARTRSALDRDDVARIGAAVGERILVELVDVEGLLHAVTLRRGRARRVPVGPTQAALAAVQRARFALRQVARGRRADLDGAANQLERAVLGEAAALLGDEPVVLVPPARLHHAPWALCPTLARRSLTSSPSAARWLLAHEAETDRRAGTETRPAVALIAGPGLEGADAEVAELASEHPGSVVLRGPDATVPAALRAFGEASIVHVAAHGRHRTDNPLFSSLQLADGPLTVHDLEALASMPSRIVLSACDSGVMAAVGNDALLGLAEALQAQGAAGVICAVSEVNDAATRPLMTRVHDALAVGRSPADALLEARQAARGDVLATATAASFSSLGA